MTRRVVVIGAGLGGLSAAAHLAGRGHDVTVVERADAPGGRAGRLELDGYTFDTGPTVLTMPTIMRDAFAAAGSNLEDHVALTPLDPVYRACFADGSTLRVRRDEDAMADEIREVCGAADARAFRRFVTWLHDLYAIEMPSFIDRNYDSAFDLVRPLRAAVALTKLGGFRRLKRELARRFADDRLRRVFGFQSLYAGLAPYEALALYGVITYMDCVEGAWFVPGGIHELAIGLAHAVEKAGARIVYGDGADEILLASGDDGPVRGVRLQSGIVERADAVVCNADLPLAYPKLVPGLRPPRRVQRAHYSPSAFVWHAGVRGLPHDDVAHHNIHFGDAWNSAFRALLREQRRMPDPSTLVTVASLSDPSLAPDGCSTIYALEPVPNLDAPIDWERERGRARDDIARRLSALGYPDVVEVEASYDPRTWRDLGIARGTPFSMSHRFRQTGPFRAANTDPRAPGLVFVGSGTVPGVGVPMVLLSGRLAAQRVEAHLR